MNIQKLLNVSPDKLYDLQNDITETSSILYSREFNIKSKHFIILNLAKKNKTF